MDSSKICFAPQLVETILKNDRKSLSVFWFLISEGYQTKTNNACGGEMASVKVSFL